ncbi:MAG: SufD family Fe-S cluster assembly protein [Alistipes sp.]|nr:SufD family Fe-S cluster assembly protein [Alistipes sp.]
MTVDRLITAAAAEPIPSHGRLAGGVYVAVDGGDMSLTVPEGVRASLLLIGRGGGNSAIRIDIERGAELSVVELFAGSTGSRLHITQSESSLCRMTTLVLSSSEVRHTVDLMQRDARFDLGGAFVLSGDDRSDWKIDVNHRSADCSSRSVVKGVASGSSHGRFGGLVYVAPDAQRTDSQQTSRNVTIGAQARIETSPQLEIYADDVKCSHGATVGQIDGEAIMYMRQRGLTEAQARRLQIEGFVGDVVMHTVVESVGGILAEIVAEKLETI